MTPGSTCDPSGLPTGIATDCQCWPSPAATASRRVSLISGASRSSDATGVTNTPPSATGPDGRWMNTSRWPDPPTWSAWTRSKKSCWSWVSAGAASNVSCAWRVERALSSRISSSRWLKLSSRIRFDRYPPSRSTVSMPITSVEVMTRTCSDERQPRTTARESSRDRSRSRRQNLITEPSRPPCTRRRARSPRSRAAPGRPRSSSAGAARGRSPVACRRRAGSPRRVRGAPRA